MHTGVQIPVFGVVRSKKMQRALFVEGSMVELMFCESMALSAFMIRSIQHTVYNGAYVPLPTTVEIPPVYSFCTNSNSSSVGKSLWRRNQSLNKESAVDI